MRLATLMCVQLKSIQPAIFAHYISRERETERVGAAFRKARVVRHWLAPSVKTRLSFLYKRGVCRLCEHTSLIVTSD